METVKHSYKEIIDFVNAGKQWQRQGVKKDSPLTGFQYAMARTLKSCSKHIDDQQEKLVDINIDTASTDDKGNILSDAQGGSVFSKEESKRRNGLIRKLMDEVIEVGVHFAKMYPDDLNAAQIQAFEGFVIREIEEPVDNFPQA